MPISKLAPPWMDIAPIQLPGREGRRTEPPESSLESAARAAATAIAADAERPFALFGHSLGGRLAARVAQILGNDAALWPNDADGAAEAGPAPDHLFISATTPTYRAAPISHLDDAAFTEAVRARFTGTPTAIFDTPGVWDIYRPTLRADLGLLETAPDFTGALPCPVTLIGGRQDATAPAARLSDWGPHATAGSTTCLLDVDHFALRSHAQAYLDLIGEALGPAAARKQGS
ncbi:hypothetical protein ATO3_16805 [Marinibacterium profundimaris]|uniref:Thioesterase domain-containing protein n=1 Tax=Marinibacterium profundimaris TaxID=1679460 RepID=A0A225NFL5_9RHOB|nr:hypothetical protein ATO3_16805 [Marinibacterium profundimaris]